MSAAARSPGFKRNSFAASAVMMEVMPAELQCNHAANQLIASADFTEMQAPRGQVAPLEFLRNQPVDFALWNTVVPAGRLHGLDFAVVNPLLERGIADAQNVCRLAWCQQSLHGWSPNCLAKLYRIAL